MHVFSQTLHLLQGVPRRRLVSFVGGMAVAFVILRLLPAIGRHQQTLEQATQGGPLGFLDNHIYAVLLLSIIIFYGLERLAQRSRERRKQAGKEDRPGFGVFWLHIGTFALMNLLVGYLLFHHVEQGSELQVLLLFFLAMLFKFVVNDHGLHNLHQDLYDRMGRWLLAVTVLGGWLVNYVARMPQVGPALLQGFIAGAVLLNVLKEQLPSAEKSRYALFASGAVLYSVLLLSF